MAKRDYAREITERRARLRFRTPLAEMGVRIGRIDLELRGADKLSDEMMKYFPVAIVACMESFFRLTLADLIDTGPPFADRIDKFDDVRVDLSALKAIHGKRMSVGDFISQLVPFNSLTDINRAFSIVLADDFLALLRSHLENPPDAERGVITDYGITADAMFAGVEDAYRLRHMYAHEFASSEKTDREQISQCVNACNVFMISANSVIDDIQSPGAPRTLEEAEHGAGESMRKAEELLLRTVQQVESRIPKDTYERFVHSQQTWREARQQFADIYGEVNNDEGMSKLLANLFVSRYLTLRREQDIERFLLPFKADP